MHTEPATKEGNEALQKQYKRMIAEGKRANAKYNTRPKADPEISKARTAERIARTRKALKEGHATNPAIRMVRSAKVRAKELGLPFDLEPTDLVVPEVCPILGIPLRVSQGYGPSQNSPSIDRIIPELGYVRGNVQVISHKANAMKNDATPADLLAFAYWCTAQFGLYGDRQKPLHGSTQYHGGT